MPDAAPDVRLRRRVNPVLVVIVVGILAMWGYVLYLAFFVGRADSPDKIDEIEFVAEAESRCAEAVTSVASLPLPESQQGDPVARAGTIALATDAFDAMVTDLHDLADTRIADPENARVVGLWLDDWETFLADRHDYVERLRVDPEARLLVSPGPNGRQITLQIDEFAAANDMISCRSPLDT